VWFLLGWGILMLGRVDVAGWFLLFSGLLNLGGGLWPRPRKVRQDGT
jgi:hypothetical protein